MKRFLAVLIFLLGALLLLASCTVQAEVSPELFVSRFAKNYPSYSPETENMFYENGKSVLFVTDSDKTRFALEMTSDERGRVQKISLACADSDKTDAFSAFVRDVISVYAADEDAEAVLKKTVNGESFAYHETLRYYYSFSDTEAGLFFAVENKKLSPEKEVVPTLKPNDIITKPAE